MNKYSSAQRQTFIADIIRAGAVSSQQELLTLLKRKGVRVTQPTLSRDLQELGVVKTANGYALADDFAHSADEIALTPQERRIERLVTAIDDYVTTVQQAANLVVVKTVVAGAQPVARAIDEAGLAEVVGTLGGDDTIFVATHDNAAAERLVRKLRAPESLSRSTRRTRA